MTLFIFAPHALSTVGKRLVDVGGMAVKPKQSFFIPTKNLESAFQSLTKKKKYQPENCELQKMKPYATNTAEFRRVLLLNYLDREADAKREIENSNVAKHYCCDICASACECEDCLPIEGMHLREIEEDTSTGIPESRCCRFTNEQKKVIKTQLIHLRASLSEDACLLSPDHRLGCTTHDINQIVEKCESLKTKEDIFE